MAEQQRQSLCPRLIDYLAIVGARATLVPRPTTTSGGGGGGGGSGASNNAPPPVQVSVHNPTSNQQTFKFNIKKIKSNKDSS